MGEFIESSFDLETKKKADLEVVMMGYEECTPGHSYGPTIRSYHLLHFITRGEGTFFIDGAEYRLQAGDIFYIPEDRVAYYEASPTDPWHYAWCDFTGRRAEGFRYQFMSCASERYVLRGRYTGGYADVIRRISVLKEATPSNYYLANSALLEIFSMMERDFFANASVSHIPTLAEQIKYYLDMNYSENLRMSDLAETFSIHPNYLSRLFQNRFHISPKKYLLQLKLSKAAYFLTVTEMPVSSISVSLGFDDPLAFSKAFRKYSGCSPTKYRAQRSGQEQVRAGMGLDMSRVEQKQIRI